MRDLGNFLNCTRRKESFETETAISPAISKPVLLSRGIYLKVNSPGRNKNFEGPELGYAHISSSIHINSKIDHLHQARPELTNLN